MVDEGCWKLKAEGVTEGVLDGERVRCYRLLFMYGCYAVCCFRVRGESLISWKDAVVQV